MSHGIKSNHAYKQVVHTQQTIDAADESIRNLERAISQQALGVTGTATATQTQCSLPQKRAVEALRRVLACA